MQETGITHHPAPLDAQQLSSSERAPRSFLPTGKKGACDATTPPPPFPGKSLMMSLPAVTSQPESQHHFRGGLGLRGRRPKRKVLALKHLALGAKAPPGPQQS